MKNIIITGATSFIGQSLINKLLEKEYFIYALVRPSILRKTMVETNRVKIIELSMDNYKNLDQYVNNNCDCFISLAWDGTRGQDRSDKEKQQKNYKNNMEALYSALRLNCNKVISAGSQAEYGHQQDLITESTVCKPNTEYGDAKLQFYTRASEECKYKGVSFKEARFFSLYGPGDHINTLIISLIKKMMKNEDCELTKCTQLWNYLYITDAVDGVIKLIENDCEDGAYNFGSFDTRPLCSFIEEMKIKLASSSFLKYGAIPYSANDNQYGINPCIKKLCSETGWSPQTPFSTGIDKTISYVKTL